MGAIMRILVVDDSSTMRSIIKNILKQIHLRNVEEANDGDIAWEKLQKGMALLEPKIFVNISCSCVEQVSGIYSKIGLFMLHTTPSKMHQMLL
jgi:CheY-like chemotaxis protein